MTQIDAVMIILMVIGAFASGVLVNGLIVNAQLAQLAPILAQYQALTAYVRVRVLPYLRYSEARTVPVEVERLLAAIDVLVPLDSAAEEDKLHILDWRAERARKQK